MAEGHGGVSGCASGSGGAGQGMGAQGPSRGGYRSRPRRGRLAPPRSAWPSTTVSWPSTTRWKHLPEIGAGSAENSAQWLAEIKVRHLATITAGFDHGRRPRLDYRPGTAGIYSNDTANMLAELLDRPVR